MAKPCSIPTSTRTAPIKNLRNGDGPTVTNDDRALRRALEIERSMVRLYEWKLRAHLTEQGFANFRKSRWL
jgi:hypothetical protein